MMEDRVGSGHAKISTLQLRGVSMAVDMYIDLMSTDKGLLVCTGGC